MTLYASVFNCIAVENVPLIIPETLILEMVTVVEMTLTKNMHFTYPYYYYYESKDYSDTLH